jgi:hypothetical protein
MNNAAALVLGLLVMFGTAILILGLRRGVSALRRSRQ